MANFSIRLSLVRLTAILLLPLMPCASSASDAASSQRLSLGELPMPAQVAIHAALGRSEPGYHASADSLGWRMQNRRHGLTAEIRADGVTLRKGAADWQLTWKGYGYGSASRTADSKIPPRADANIVKLERGAVTEWYVNGPRGIEHGFTIASPPPLLPGKPLVLELGTSGALEPSIDAKGTGLTLANQDGQVVVSYRDLTAWDAVGRTLPARIHLTDSREIRLVIDDSNAHYPIVIDPLFEQAVLTASDGAAEDQFGAAVAISGDTIVVGAASDGRSQGSAYVFVKPGGGWANMTETAKLTASDGALGDQLGFAVAISGNTIALGAPSAKIGNQNDQGAVYMFVRPVGGWANMTETAKLTASDGKSIDNFGFAVAMSGDTVVAGSYRSNVDNKSDQGSAYVFVRPGGGWANMTETAKLTASDGAAEDLFGFAVAINSDTAVIGAFAHNVDATRDQGSAYVFVRPGGGWSNMTETAKLTASDGRTSDQFGNALAIDGNAIVVGAWVADVDRVANQGAAYLFLKPGGGWSDMTESAKLVASDGKSSDAFGIWVDIKGDNIIVGADLDDEGSNRNQGSVYLFAKPINGWTSMTETAKLLASDGRANDAFGFALAMSGSTVAVGAPNDDIGAVNRQGSAYVFEIGSLPPAIGARLPGAEIGAPYNSDIAISGGAPPFLVSITDGSLPPGLTINNAGIVAGAADSTARNATVTFMVTDQNGAVATKTAKIVIVQQVTVATRRLGTARLGRSYRGALRARLGQAPFTWSIASGALPLGLNLDSATGSITGTPSQVGTFNVEFQVNDSLGGQAKQTLSLTVR